MNLLNNQERRTRIKKPISIIFISILLILSPVYNYYLQLFIRNLPVNWTNIRFIHFNKLELAFLIVPVICGIGLYLIKKWAWYLFILYSIILILFNVYASIVNPIKFNFYSLFESTVIFFGAVFFLKKDISAPYLKMYPRGFRGEKRNPIQIQVRINSTYRLTKDISDAGFYVDWNDAPFEINEEVTVELDTKISKREIAAGVVRKDENGVGFAFRHLDEEDNKWIQKVTVSVLILFSIFTFYCSKKTKDNTLLTALMASGNNSKATSAAIATLPSQLTYVSASEDPKSGNYTITLGNSLTITNATAIVIGASVVYNVTPSLPNGLTIDPLTGSITGTPTAVQILTSYVVIATYTAQSGYRLSSSTGLTRTFKISVVAAELTANVPSQLTYISTSVASSSGNYIVVWGNTLTITNTTPSVIGANVVYSVNPALPSGLTLDSLTGHIVGIPTTNQALTSYVVTATYTAQSGYQLSTATGLTRTIKIYVGSAATITNLTCNATGTGTAIGCTASFPFTCTSSSSCYASQASCYNLSDCIQ